MITRSKAYVPSLVFDSQELSVLNRTAGLPIRTTLIGLLYVCDDDGWFEWNPKAIQKAMKGVLIHGDPTQAMKVLKQEGYLRYQNKTKDEPAKGQIPARYRED